MGLGNSPNNALFDRPGSLSEGLDFADINRGRPDQRYSMISQVNLGEEDAQLGSVFSNLDGESGRLNRSRVVSNSRNGDVLAHTSNPDRSESLPPQQRTTSSSPFQHLENQYSLYPVMPQPLGSSLNTGNLSRGRYEEISSFRRERYC